ncbi:MAG: HAMP domain-containing histidine kinase [Polyangiaceae bacterium]|nr:HAMP domain-containing histidine kinase [Polyangiaceae bacterium]
MMGIVAHDLRNLLGSVLTCTSRIRRHLPESNDLIGNPVGVIEAAVARMNRLIQDLLDVARMEAGRFSIERAGVSTAHLLFECVDSQKPLASEASLDLVLEAAPGLPRIWADRDRLLQVFENLIGNALKFTEPGGRITVGAEPRKGEVLFWVADTGAGIPADDLPHVFDRFWQTRKPNRRGAGLGLAVVKGIVEAHGGRITADSAPERGSKFTFTIPIVTPTVATTSRDLCLA